MRRAGFARVPLKWDDFDNLTVKFPEFVSRSAIAFHAFHSCRKHGCENLLDSSFGQPGVYGDGTDLCILTYGNGTYLSRQAEKELREQHNTQVRIVDIRWLVPLPEQEILQAAASCKHILIVDEGRRSGSISEALRTLLLEAGVTAPVTRLTGADSFIPLGDAARLVLPGKDEIIAAALQPGRSQAV